MLDLDIRGYKPETGTYRYVLVDVDDGYVTAIYRSVFEVNVGDQVEVPYPQIDGTVKAREDLAEVLAPGAKMTITGKVLGTSVSMDNLAAQAKVSAEDRQSMIDSILDEDDEWNGADVYSHWLVKPQGSEACVAWSKYHDKIDINDATCFPIMAEPRP